MTVIPVKRALVSVWDKTGLVPFVERLVDAGVEIVSSGGTARAIAEAGLAVTEVADVTGAPEILGGRVKTLHPAIHGGILADPSLPGHAEDLTAEGIEAFQLVVCNLYPFEETVADPDVTLAEAVEQIDIGGPAMTRAAAKNHAAVGIVTDPDQYDAVAAAVEAGGLDDGLRRELAREAFFRTASYDAAIVDYLEAGDRARMVIPLRRAQELRYGENPHQPAVVYSAGPGWWSKARQLQGKDLSFNNLVDAEAAWRLAADLPRPAAVVVKHTNACGVAVADDLSSAFATAWECDPLSAFGGVIALNAPLDGETSEAIAAKFVEIVIAPEVSAEAAAVLERKAALRVLEAPFPSADDLDFRRVEGGLLVQERDHLGEGPGEWEHVAGPVPDQALLDELWFAWVVCAHTKSNAIVITKDRAAIGVGAGDQSRVGAGARAVVKAGDRAHGAVAASDAFFPFRDGLDALAEAGVVAVVEPGGSKRDDEVIAAADEQGVTLMFTGRRHFRH